MPMRQFIVELFGARNDESLCKSCQVPDRLHVRRIVFGNRAVHVISRELACSLPHDKEAVDYFSSLFQPIRSVHFPVI